jgi:hypothetical protein
VSYNSPCRACDHKHYDRLVCNWQIHKTGHIKLKPVYSEGLWGLGSALHHHGKDEDGKDVISSARINTYKDETFEYEQEVDCGCRYYVPSDNLEYLEWKYDESNKSV